MIEIDAKNPKILKRWPVSPGESPSSLAMDRKNSRLFIGCRNGNMVVMDAQNGKVVQTFSIGKGVDATAFNQVSQTIYNSCADGTMTIFHEDSPDHYRLVKNVTTQPGSRNLAVDSQTGHVFLSAAQFGPMPAPTTSNPKPRKKVIPGTFEILVVGK